MAERLLARARPGFPARRLEHQVASVWLTTGDGERLWDWPPAAFDPASRARLARARDAAAGRFTFLNDARDLSAPVDWAAPGSSRLWRFHLHAFPFAVDLGAAARTREPGAYNAFRALVSGWLDQHPLGPGDPWHPFVVSGRLVHWAIARSLVWRQIDADLVFKRRLAEALIGHGLYLERHLELDVGGNHLLKNAVALLVAGCVFEGPAARRWQARAAALFERELPRQVLADGGHYERSPMYHLLVLEDLLIALHAAGRRELPVANLLADAVRRMQRFAKTLQHPDGEIPLFNDAVLGEAPEPSLLVGPSTLALEPGLVASGYFLMPAQARGRRGVLIADCGAPGPDDLPAHVHADALSFELSVDGRRVLVDGGVEGYDPGPRRDLLRGTRSHNTVEVDGADQSEVWSAFRVGSRARVRLERWEAEAGRSLLRGSHDGYTHLGRARPAAQANGGSVDGSGVSQLFPLPVQSGPVHEREIVATDGRGWRVLDLVRGRGFYTATARFRLHPDLRWRPAGARWDIVDDAGTLLLNVEPFGGSAVSLEAGLYAERFGKAVAIQVLCLTRHGQAPMAFGAWLLLPGGEPALA